ncbi:MAG TPA: hypothetical protein VNO23_04875 [Candidatus Binatia bacterium]|nr:hypothetical protein [Candidatus Binatia bacterium]
MLTDHSGNGRAPCAECGAAIGPDDPAISMPHGLIHVRCFPVEPVSVASVRRPVRRPDRLRKGKTPEA